ncbi:hypothetical protein GJI79_04755 [Lactococcus lactis subsp. cremoris]|nr:hypothetical protein [Lactococcus cremoris]
MTIIGATLAICGLSFVTSSFNILIYSQVFLSIQLPITIFLQIYLTSSKKVGNIRTFGSLSGFY